LPDFGKAQWNEQNERECHADQRNRKHAEFTRDKTRGNDAGSREDKRAGEVEFSECCFFRSIHIRTHLLSSNLGECTAQLVSC